MPSTPKVWRLLGHDPQAADQLAGASGISPTIAQLLLNRGISDPRAAKEFMEASLAGLHAPALLPGVTEAAERIHQAAKAGRLICVYGDYDVDGTTATAILLLLFRKLGVAATFHVPNRMDDGYGLNSEAIRQLAESGVSLLVSVDCGITAVEEAAEAKRLGVELIITDHHEPKEHLPEVDVIVHPALPGSAYPNSGLSGAGVAFKLAWAVAQRWCGSDRVTPELREFLMDALGLAALGAVADVMPLRGENRILVKRGLERLLRKPSIGVHALIQSSGLAESKVLKADDIGFRLAPRLNAAGRLECARLVVELLTTTNTIKAKELADYLENLNTQRQTLERKITSEARALVENHQYHLDAGIVLGSPDWHPGVVGIVASRMVDTYGRPALIIAEQPADEPSGGSGRSVAGLPLHEALRACAEELISHGGHAMAAGFRVRPSRIDALRQLFRDFVAGHFDGEPPPPQLRLDTEIPLASLTFGLMKELDKLEPYGAENPRPRFLATGLTLDETPRRIGAGERHLSFRVRQGNTLVRAVAWGMGDRLDELMAANGRCCVAFTPKINEWKGSRAVEMEVIDFHPGADPTLV